MNHLKDILAIGAEKHPRQTHFESMTRGKADEICRWIEHYAKDIGFKMNDHAYDMFQHIFNSNILHRKGSYICGPHGIGKTFLFLALRRYERAQHHPNPVINLNVRVFEETYKAEGSEYFLEMVQYPRLAIHNFGFQSLVNNDYGTKRNLILELLDQRYDIYQQNQSHRTFITSNKDGNYVNSFGPAISRRIQAMMNYFEVKTK